MTLAEKRLFPTGLSKAFESNGLFFDDDLLYLQSSFLADSMNLDSPFSSIQLKVRFPDDICPLRTLFPPIIQEGQFIRLDCPPISLLCGMNIKKWPCCSHLNTLYFRCSCDENSSIRHFRDTLLNILFDILLYVCDYPNWRRDNGAIVSCSSIRHANIFGQLRRHENEIALNFGLDYL